MKILHVNGALAGGGIEQYLGQLFREFGERGHQNIFLYGNDPQGAADPPKTKTFYIQDITKVRCKRLNVKLKMVRSILDSCDPDVVYIHQVLNPILVDFLTKERPSVRFVHGFKMICPDGRKTLKSVKKACSYRLSYLCQAHSYEYRCMPRNPFIGLPLIHSSIKIARIHRKRSFMIVASKFMKSILLHNGFKEKSITVIPYFTYLPKLRIGTPPINEPVILCLGRVVEAKGMRHLLRALKWIHEKARLVIVGEGPALNGLKSLSKKLDCSSRISFLGWLSHEKLDTLYRKCSVVVVPSVWPEPFGIVGIEAMAYQKPVVAFEVGGISEWLKDGETGFLVRPKEDLELANKINLFLERPDIAEKMGRRGREMVKKRFVPEAHIEKVLSLFQKATNSFPNRI